jgi:prepilin-type N-terminal cleavage/methylation domain-containing protein
MTGIVIPATECDDKAIRGRVGSDRVANIRNDCVIRDQQISKKLSERKTKEMRKQKGFSLIELLIVVAIILIIAAIAIPNLLRARMAANESSAVASVRTITTGEVTYQTAYPTVGYAPALVNLGGAVCRVRFADHAQPDWRSQLLRL